MQGDLTIQGGTYGGGLICNTFGSAVSVENCFVTGNLFITSSESGGLIGRNNAMVTGCKVDAIDWMKGKEATGGFDRA